MALRKYRAKRSFSQTPEPVGRRSARARTSSKQKSGHSCGPLQFVIQKHAASRLHYDLRLELDGVMKSWAVPKGPSLNPADKRLAMQVEDHPIEYNKFEGVIPKDNYGAGTVMVWDRGSYRADGAKNRAESEKLLRAGLKKGDAKFTLRGRKLNGSFVLVKMYGRGENTWLLIKHRDQHTAERDVMAEAASAVSGRTMEEIAADRSKSWKSNRGQSLGSQAQGLSSKPDVTKGRKTGMPHKIKPMLATAVDAPFDRPDWLFEIKWDGYRAIAEVGSKQVKLYSRNGTPFTDRYQPVVNELKALGHQAVLDGEVVVVDRHGHSKFQLLQRYLKTGDGDLTYYVFDILWLNGYDLRQLPLRDRKEILRELLVPHHVGEGLPDSGRLKFSDHLPEKGKQFFKAAEQQGLEGIIAKDAGSPYRHGARSHEWLKMKTVMRQEVVVGGFTEPQGSRKKFGALVVGIYDGKTLRYVGHAGGGFDEQTLGNTYDQLKKIVITRSPFAEVPKTNAPVTWVKPQLVAEVKFQEWTDGGHLRKPIFIGLREDKPAKEVAREKPEPAEAAVAANPGSNDQTVTINRHPVHLTNLNKVYWPKDGYAKCDLVSYYRDIAKVILPYLKGRPQSLHRHPHGIDGESFYQKDFQQHPPDWVEVAKIYSESNRKKLNWLVCNDEASLAYLANLGCIELNPWHSRTDRLTQPDYLLIDLDAKTSGFDTVVEVAKQVKQVLDLAGVAGYPKTSGATGLHVCLPLQAKYEYDQVKQFAEIIVNLVHQRLPKITSLERNPDKRKNHIYLDYLQNRKGQTMAAPYCLRPRSGAPVSTPLQWSELRKGLDPRKFTIKTIPKRLERKGDLWRPVLGKGVNLEAALKKLGG